MEKKAILSWLNKGNPIRISKMTLGAREEFLDFKVEYPEPMAQEKVARTAWLFKLKRIMAKWAIKTAFPTMNINEIEANLDLTDFEEYQEFSDIVFTTNFGDVVAKDSAPKSEGEKK